MLQPSRRRTGRPSARAAGVRAGISLFAALGIALGGVPLAAFADDAAPDAAQAAAAAPAAAPEPAAAPAPAPAPAPEPAPAPDPAPAPAPAPAQAQAPAPAPAPEPAPAPAPAPEQAPSPATAPAPEAPAPEPAPAAAASSRTAAAEPAQQLSSPTGDPSGDTAGRPGRDSDLKICHATGNPGKWVVNSPARSGIVSGHAGSHHQNGRDIIPDFTYTVSGTSKFFPGQNWNDAGKAIYANNCATPDVPDPTYSTPTVTLTTEPCFTTGATTPLTGSAGISGLTVGQTYRLRITVAGAMFPSYEGNFLAATPTTVKTFSISGPGIFTATVTRSGAGHGEAAATHTLTLNPCPRENPDPDPVTICHATGNPGKWVVLSPDRSGIVSGHAGSHHQDGRDIIPPFTYTAGGTEINFPGQNWEDGQAIYDNDCATPDDPDPTYSLPTVTLLMEQCLAADGTLPESGNIGMSGLTVGQSYRAQFTLDGTALPALDQTFTADATTLMRTFALAGAGDYAVTLTRVGAPTREGSATHTLTLTPCPDAPPEPSLVVTPEACDVDGDGDAFPRIFVELSELNPEEDYELSVHAGAEEVYATSVSGSEDPVTLWITLPAGGSYEVRLTAGDDVVVAQTEVEDCPVADVDLSLEKSAAVAGGTAELGSTIRYTLTVTASGEGAAVNPSVTDVLPAGLSFVGAVTAPAGWTATGGDTVTATFDGEFVGTAEIVFDAMVTALPEGGSVRNEACVSSEGSRLLPPADRHAAARGLSQAGDEGGDPYADSNPDNDCGEATTPVRSVTVSGAAECVNDTPWFNYSVTPGGFEADANLPIVLIWWTPSAYAQRDASIPASDPAAILADGAAQVDVLATPDGWASGEALSGRMLWPGAAVDSAGNPTDWPGWTELPDGSWVEDPAAPFYDLRGETVVEIRINPTASNTTVYPPATPVCAAQPPQPPTVTPPAIVPAVTGAPAAGRPLAQAPVQRVTIANTGSAGPAGAAGALALVLLGFGLIVVRAGRSARRL